MRYFSDHKHGQWNKAWAITAIVKTFDGDRQLDYLVYTKSGKAQEVQAQFEYHYKAKQILKFQRRYECHYCHHLFTKLDYQLHLDAMTIEASCVEVKPNEVEYYRKCRAEQERHIKEDVL